VFVQFLQPFVNHLPASQTGNKHPTAEIGGNGGTGGNGARRIFANFAIFDSGLRGKSTKMTKANEVTSCQLSAMVSVASHSF
jgi:hypothetical protein